MATNKSMFSKTKDRLDKQMQILNLIVEKGKITQEEIEAINFNTVLLKDALYALENEVDSTHSLVSALLGHLGLEAQEHSEMNEEEKVEDHYWEIMKQKKTDSEKEKKSK